MYGNYQITLVVIYLPRPVGDRKQDVWSQASGALFAVPGVGFGVELHKDELVIKLGITLRFLPCAFPHFANRLFSAAWAQSPDT